VPVDRLLGAGVGVYVGMAVGVIVAVTVGVIVILLLFSPLAMQQHPHNNSDMQSIPKNTILLFILYLKDLTIYRQIYT
jgi:uncharacterized membrane protein YqhA